MRIIHLEKIMFYIMCVFALKFSFVHFFPRTHLLVSTSKIRRKVSNMTNEMNQLLAKGSLFKNRQVCKHLLLSLLMNII